MFINSTASSARRKKEKTVRILKLIALGALMIGIGAVPSPRAVTRILKELALKDTGTNRRKVYQYVYYLKRHGYLVRTKDVYRLSDDAKLVIEKDNLWNLKIRVPEHWDLAWRLVLFDIPHERSKVRIRFIRHLQALGLVFYQRSVWVHPYPIEREVLQIAHALRIGPYVSFVTALNIDGYGSLKKRFGLM